MKVPYTYFGSHFQVSAARNVRFWFSSLILIPTPGTLGYLQPDGSATETDVVDALQACIRDIRTWMVQDKLQLNDAKTEFLIIKVSAAYSVRNLGAWFDANMNMTTHINTICQSIYYHLHNIHNYNVMVRLL